MAEDRIVGWWAGAEGTLGDTRPLGAQAERLLANQALVREQPGAAHDAVSGTA